MQRKSKREMETLKKTAVENPDAILGKIARLDEKTRKDRRDFRSKAEREKLQRIYEAYTNKTVFEAQREAQAKLEAAANEQHELMLRQQQEQFRQQQEQQRQQQQQEQQEQERQQEQMQKLFQQTSIPNTQVQQTPLQQYLPNCSCFLFTNMHIT